MSDSWTHETERYRFAARDDMPAFVELLSDPEVGRWLWFTPFPADAIESYFAPFLDRQRSELDAARIPRTAVFAVEDSSGDFLGHGAVVGIDASPDGYEIGFQLRRKAWGRGVGTRLGQFLCAYAIQYCRAYRLEGGCLEGNVASVAILRKLGFELEGTRPGYRVKEGVRHTELCFGVEVQRLDAALYEGIATRTGLRGR